MGRTAAENVEVTNEIIYDGIFDDYADHISPEVLTFGSIQPGDTVVRSATIYTHQRLDEWNITLIHYD